MRRLKPKRFFAAASGARGFQGAPCAGGARAAGGAPRPAGRRTAGSWGLTSLAFNGVSRFAVRQVVKIAVYVESEVLEVLEGHHVLPRKSTRPPRRFAESQVRPTSGERESTCTYYLLCTCYLDTAGCWVIHVRCKGR
jgi:hypothetical protein